MDQTQIVAAVIAAAKFDPAKLEMIGEIAGGAALAGCATTWAAEACGVAPSATAVLALPAPPLWMVDAQIGWHLPLAYSMFAASTNALMWCRHISDRQRGGDIAARARARRGLRYVAREVIARRHVRAGALASAQGSVIGRDQAGGLVRIGLGSSSEHVLVAGSTGYGKTKTQELLARLAIEGHGCGAVVIDPKCDPEVREVLAEAAEKAGKPFIVFDEESPTSYNVLKRGTVDELIDKLLAGHVFTEPHYETLGRSYLQYLLKAFQAGGVEITLRTVIAHFGTAQMMMLARSLPERAMSDLHAYLDSISEREWVELNGIRNRLMLLANSGFGPYLEPNPDYTDLDLLDAVRRGAVVLIQFPADRFPHTAALMSASVVTDLIVVTALGQDGALPPTLVMIDEAGAVQPGKVIRLFQRARAARMSVVIAVQHLSDLDEADAARRVAGGTLMKQIIANVQTVISHRQVEPDAAQLIADVAGTRWAWELTSQVDDATIVTPTGTGTRKRVREYVVHPDRIKRLNVGEAVVVHKGGACVVRILDPNKVRIRARRAGGRG